MDMAGELTFIYKLMSTLKRKADDPVNLLVMPKCSRTAIVGQGPKAANAHMRFDKMKPGEKLDWLEEARVMAILGSCSRTMPSLRSGVRCFLAFAGLSPGEISFLVHIPYVVGHHEKGPVLPPKLDILLAWSTLFRCTGTWKNYTGYVKTCCILVGADIKVKQTSVCACVCVVHDRSSANPR